MISRKSSAIVFIAIIAIVTVAALSGCTTPTPTAAPTGAPTATPTPAPKETLMLATTTSMQDTGLLDYLKPYFDSQYNADLKWTSVGSGQALALGRSGDVDVMIVHSPAAEKTFIDEGYGWNRTTFAHNFFVIVGPANDPAGIHGMTNASQAFQKIRDAKATFVSRGDESGTHVKEKDIWKSTATGTVPSNVSDASWYKTTGMGQADSLRMSEQMQAYMLSDLSTFMKNQKNLTLVIHVESDPGILINKYSLIAINNTRHTHANYDMAMNFIEFMTSQETQQKISTYGQDKYGKPLFYADLLNQTT
jgi:tungstate transport system substrate-binding protein